MCVGNKSKTSDFLMREGAAIYIALQPFIGSHQHKQGNDLLKLKSNPKKDKNRISLCRERDKVKRTDEKRTDIGIFKSKDAVYRAKGEPYACT